MSSTDRTGEKRFLAILMVVQAALMAFRIGKEPLWQDEVNLSLNWPGAPWSLLVELFSDNPEQHPLYYLLMRGWLVFGTSEAALRSLSALLAVAATPLVFALGRRIAGTDVARLAAILFASSPFLVYYGQEARPYTLLCLLSALSTLLLMTWHQSGSRRTLAGYAIACVLGVYTHFFFLYLMLGHTVAALFSAPGERVRRSVQLLVAQAVVGLLYVPWGLLLISNLSAEQTWKGIPHIVFGVPYTILRFSLGYAVLLANYGWQRQLWAFATQDLAIWIPAALAFGLTVYMGLRETVVRGWGGIVVLTGIAVPMAAALATSVVTILVSERYFIVCFPFYSILLALGLTRLFRGSSRFLARSVGAVFIVVTATSLGYHYFRDAFGKEQWREVAAAVRLEHGEAVPIYVTPPTAGSPFRLYFGARADDVVVAEWERFPPTAALDEFWLVAAYAEDPEAVENAFATTHVATERQLFPKEAGIWLFHFARRDRL